MRAIIATAVLILAGCAGAPDPAPPSERVGGMSEQLAAPTPVDVVNVTAADEGKTVSVTVGKRISVALVGVPTAGYLWSVVDQPAFLSKPEEGGGPTTAAQKQPGFVGGNHWEVFTFTADRAGEGELKLEQRRPWEKNEPPTQTFKVRVKAE